MDVKEKNKNVEEPFRPGPISLFEYLKEEREPVLCLDVPQEPVSGWIMKNLNRVKVLFSHSDHP